MGNQQALFAGSDGKGVLLRKCSLIHHCNAKCPGKGEVCLWDHQSLICESVSMYICGIHLSEYEVYACVREYEYASMHPWAPRTRRKKRRWTTQSISPPETKSSKKVSQREKAYYSWSQLPSPLSIFCLFWNIWEDPGEPSLSGI